MESKSYSGFFFLVILLGISLVTYFIFQPFLLAIMLAVFLAVALQRPYNFFLEITGHRKGLSSFLVSFFGVSIAVAFISLVVGLIAGEATSFYQNIVAQGDAYHKYVEPFVAYVNQSQFLGALGFGEVINSEMIGKFFSQIAQSIFIVVQQTYRGIAATIFLLVVVFFTLYYLLIEGKKLVNQVLYLSPLKNSHKKVLIEKFFSITRATAKGALIIAIIQGTVGIMLFTFLGLPSAIILGIAMMFFSLIPMVGSGLIWLPTAIIMFVTGNIWQGWVILAVGFGIISSIDNFVRPKLVGKDTQMHPLVVFFATLGGLNMFGFLGFIIGPVIVALFLSFWDIYAEEYKGQLKRYEI